jgi:prepilin peptidase CpaA
MQNALQTLVPQACAVSIAGVAALIDHRTGKIPNWLTLPALVVAPAYWGFAHGLMGFAESLAGILVCGIPALVAYQAAGLPGGDLKLFGAVGGFLGPTMGLEVEFFALVAASVFGVVLLARRGRLRATLLDTLYFPINRFLPEKKRRVPEAQPTEQIRMGPFVLFGTLVAIARHSRQWMQ